MIVFQSSGTVPPPCPIGTFENSRQHARVIYGWVRGPCQTQSPERTAEILPSFTSLADSTFHLCALAPLCEKSLFIGVHPWLKTSFLPNEPKLKIISYCLYVGCVKTVWLRFPKRTHFPWPWSFKAIQRLSKRFKGSGEKKLFFWKSLVALACPATAVMTWWLKRPSKTDCFPCRFKR